MDKSRYKIRLQFDRLLSKSLWSQSVILAVFFVIALVLSYLLLPLSGFECAEFCHSKDIRPWLLPIYLLIDQSALSNLYFGNEVEGSAVHGWMLTASSISFLIGTFVFNGMIIGFITSSIERRAERHRKGDIHYLKSGHYIIMGYDDMVPSIIDHIFERDNDAYVLLFSAAGSEQINEKLKKVFSPQLKHIIINYGHRTSANYYRDIHLEAARQIYIVGLRTMPSHDAINVECVDSICSYLNRPEITVHPERITCVFEDLDTYAAFKTSEIFEKIRNLGIEFVPYNFYTGWAKQVFVRQKHKDMDNTGEEIRYPSVYGGGIDTDSSALTVNDTRYVHLVFVGTTNFAVAFAMEAAHVLHFPNGPKVRTLITFIDKNADIEKDEFIVRNRHFFEVQPYYYSDLSKGAIYQSKEDYLVSKSLYFTKANGYSDDDSNFLDVEFEFIKGDVFSYEVQDVIGRWAKEHNQKQYLSIFLAMAVQHQNFVMGMNMPDAVYDNQVPVFIRQDHSDNFVSNLRKADIAMSNDKKKNTYYYMKDGQAKSDNNLSGRYANIYPFGMNESSYSADEWTLKLAKLINYLYATMPQANKFQSLQVLYSMTDSLIWNEADKHWNSLSVALKWSNLYNAYSLRVKLSFLRTIRGQKIDDTSRDTQELTDDEIKILARVEHNRWNVEKLLMGYRKPHWDEDKYNVDEKLQDNFKKNKNRFIHHDIRPFEQLDDIKKLDIEFATYIPWLFEMTQE